MLSGEVIAMASTTVWNFNNPNDGVGREVLRQVLDHPIPAPSSSSVDSSTVYCGPTDTSNWVLPGALLVGRYPVAETDSATTLLLKELLGVGIKTFVCLCEEYPLSRCAVMGVQQTSGDSAAPRPYFDEVRELVGSGGDGSSSKLDELTFVHFPILDSKCAEDGRIVKLAINLVKALQRGEVIYVHCTQGSGRTGALVSVMLHMMYGLDATDAMVRCQLLHDKRRCMLDEKPVLSPQTAMQRIQVARIIDSLAMPPPPPPP